MRVPSKAGANKLDNPTRVMPNQQPGTEPHVWQGNEPCEAEGRAVGQPQCESVKVLSPEIAHVSRDQGVHKLEVNIDMDVKGECISAWRGLSPWRVDENVCIGTWESQRISKKLRKNGQNVMTQYASLAVGLSHSRGVGRVMPVENNSVHSKGLAI
jgi:hypothetical protein